MSRQAGIYLGSAPSLAENEFGGNREPKQEKSPPNHGDEISSAGKNHTRVYLKWASGRAEIGHFLPFYTGVCSPYSLADENAYPGSLVCFYIQTPPPVAAQQQWHNGSNTTATTRQRRHDNTAIKIVAIQFVIYLTWPKYNKEMVTYFAIYLRLS